MGSEPSKSNVINEHKEFLKYCEKPHPSIRSKSYLDRLNERLAIIDNTTVKYKDFSRYYTKQYYKYQYDKNESIIPTLYEIERVWKNQKNHQSLII